MQKIQLQFLSSDIHHFPLEKQNVSYAGCRIVPNETLCQQPAVTLTNTRADKHQLGHGKIRGWNEIIFCM